METEQASQLAIPRHRAWFAMTKPGIVASNVLTAAAGLALAPVFPGLVTAAAALLGTALLIAGSGSLNMLMERDTDALMERTRTRPLASGVVGPFEALALGVVTVAAGTAMLALMVNALTAVLGLIATVVYVLIYTPLKRHTQLAIPVGAVAGALPPVMGWTAATGSLGPAAWLLFTILFLWQMPHFYGIGLFRAADYRKAGLDFAPDPTSPAAPWIMRATTILLLAAGVLLPFVSEAGAVYVAASLVAVAPMVYQVCRPIDDIPAWARRVFLASLVYLPLFAVGAFVDRLM